MRRPIAGSEGPPLPAPSVIAHGTEQLPALTTARVFTDWSIEPVTVVLLLAAAYAYLAGVRRLRRRGVAWSSGRCVLWLSGLGVIFFATSSGIGTYDGTLFSVHAGQHMLLSMLAPVPLALAAPVTLALRALPRGGRRALLAVIHSRVAKLIAHPVSALGIFIVSPFVLYYSPLYEATLRHDWLHNLSHVHFVATGFLLFALLLGLDPLPNRMSYVLRFMMIISLGPMHILLGIPIMMGTDVFALDWYEGLGRTWGPTLVADQQFGGGLLWVFGDVVTVAFLGGMYGQWLKSDARDAKRIDRHLDRLYGDGPTMPVPWATQGERPGIGQGRHAGRPGSQAHLGPVAKTHPVASRPPPSPRPEAD